MIQFRNIRNTGNIGDLASSPAAYFDWPEHHVGNYEEAIPPCDAVIFGGGTLTSWAEGRAPKGAKAILWGTGSTNHGETEPSPDPEGFDMIGTREWTFDREVTGKYVPCASCMSPLFNLKYYVKHEAVRFMNASPQIKSRYPLGANDLPTMENTESFEDTIMFLGSAETVVTNSFHGMYWATLLGKRVIFQPYSSKFWRQKFPAAMIANANDWRGVAGWVKQHPNALADCRAQNWSFYERVMELINA